ncbi:MAG: toll/interleukin-1 receptor domain-containing protein [Fimbriimonadaceae bacterium]|nr:toll/interleukin-1 receptor domain-containing protein [Fimbriimonadaceae bacterium]
MAKFSGDLKPVIDFVGRTLHDDNKDELLALWRVADCSLDYGSEDRMGYWEVYIRVGLKAQHFRPIRAQKKREALEAELLEIAGPVVNAYDDLYLRGVHIYPIAENDDSWRGGVELPVRIDSDDEDELWKRGLLRLFVSHRSSDRVRLSKLKVKLREYGIDCFLAHEDIQETKAWRDMIKQGLQSCHAMVTVGSNGFKESIWCNQEIGWALCRGILVLPLLAGEPPEGFHSDIQGPTVDLANPDDAALKVVKAMLKESRLRPLVFEAFVELINEASSWESLRDVGYCLERLDNCPADKLKKLKAAFEKHPKSEGLYSRAIPNWLLAQEQKLGSSKKASGVSDTATQAIDEYDPFADD